MKLSLSRWLPIAAALMLVTTASRAQTAFNEVEPNSVKAEANLVTGMVAGDTINGTTTGSTATAGSTLATTADTFRVKTAALPLGIYRHRLVITSSIAGHTGRILGLTQSGGVISTISTTFQSSVATSTPARFVQWYGFGKQEELYFQIIGTATTTAPYVVTLVTDQIEPINVGNGSCFAAGTLTLQTVGFTTTDTDTWVYDGTLTAIPNYGNDDEPAPGTTVQSKLVRTFAPGDYYYAVARFETGNNLPAATDERFTGGLVVDFPDIIVNSQSETATNFDLSFGISDGVNSVIVPAAKLTSYEIVWGKFTVSGTPCAASSGSQYCFGEIGCPCSNNSSPTAGQGCAYAMTGGASLSSTGISSIASDTFQLQATNLPFPPGGQGSILLFQGTSPTAVPFNDGKRCAGGNMVRLGVKLHTGTTANYPEVGDVSIAIKGMNTAGTGRFYQGHFRTVPMTACGTNSNTTNGVTTVWIP